MRKHLGPSLLSLLCLLVLTRGAPLEAQPRFEPVAEATLLAGSPLHIPLDGSDPLDRKLTYRVTVSSEVVTARVLTGNRSLRIKVTGFGDMVFELFDGRAPRVTERIVELANGHFYDGVLFHRIINDFVIQGGDPTGTGSGGSTLPNFDDQFHVELQHNRTGLLSMAKTTDDTNNSQFFITEGPQRHLDYNHSIFGILVEGEAVREGISSVAVDTSSRPLTNVVMESVESFLDPQNGVLLLQAAEGTTGAVDVTVIATNEVAQEFRQTFRVNVTPDTTNSNPFLADIPTLTTPIDTPVTYPLVAIDVEGDPAFYLDEFSLATNGLAVPVQADARLAYTVDFNTGLLTVTPSQGLSGPQRFTVATGVQTNAIDYQVVTIQIGDPPATP